VGLIDHGGTDGRAEANRDGLVRTGLELLNQAEGRAEWRETVVAVVGTPERNVFVRRDQQVSIDLAYPLVLGGGSRTRPVICSLLEAGRRCRVGVDDGYPLGLNWLCGIILFG
jgi:hypothetical protein